MQLYPGVNPIQTAGSSSPGFVTYPFPAGFGSYTLAADCLADGDTRNAGNLDAGEQGNRDAIVWLTYRTWDLVSGGTYTGAPYDTAQINTATLFGFSGTVGFTGGTAIENPGQLFILNTTNPSMISGLAVLHVGDPGGVLGIGHIQVENGSSIIVANGGEIVVQSGAEILVSAGGTFNTALASFSTFAGSTVYSGPGGYRVDRVDVVNPSGGITVADATQFDVIYCTTCSVDNGSVFVVNSVTLTAPADGTLVGIRVRVCVPGASIANGGAGNTHAYVQVIAGGGTTVGNAAIDSGTGDITEPGFVDLMVVATSGAHRTWAPIARSS